MPQLSSLSSSRPKQTDLYRERERSNSRECFLLPSHWYVYPGVARWVFYDVMSNKTLVSKSGAMFCNDVLNILLSFCNDGVARFFELMLFQIQLRLFKVVFFPHHDAHRTAFALGHSAVFAKTDKLSVVFSKLTATKRFPNKALVKTTAMTLFVIKVKWWGTKKEFFNTFENTFYKIFNSKCF